MILSSAAGVDECTSFSAIIRTSIATTMKLLSGLILLLLTAISTTLAASSWTFEDGTVTIQEKGAGVGAGDKEKYGLPMDPDDTTADDVRLDSLRLRHSPQNHSHLPSPIPSN